jgi:hypothetical protein
MSNNNTDDVVEKAKKGALDARDSVSEALHKSSAEAERARREVEGEDMPLGERIKSGANEAKERTAAEIDKAKRSIRDKT